MSVVAVQPSRSGGYRRGIVPVLLGAPASSWMGLGVRMTEDAWAWQILALRSFSMMMFPLIIIAWRNPGPFTLIGGALVLTAVTGDTLTGERERQRQIARATPKGF